MRSATLFGIHPLVRHQCTVVSHPGHRRPPVAISTNAPVEGIHRTPPRTEVKSSSFTTCLKKSGRTLPEQISHLALYPTVFPRKISNSIRCNRAFLCHAPQRLVSHRHFLVINLTKNADVIRGVAQHAKGRLYCLELSWIFRGGTMPNVTYVLARKYARNDCLRQVENEDDSTSTTVRGGARTMPSTGALMEIATGERRWPGWLTTVSGSMPKLGKTRVPLNETEKRLSMVFKACCLLC